MRLSARQREHAGKGAARRLRQAGELPAIVYGHGETVAIAISQQELLNIRQSEAGENAIIELAIEGAASPQKENVILREIQIDPISQQPLHVDLYRVRMDETLTVVVPLEFVNEPEDRVKAAGVMLTPLLREVEVECLPGDIPDLITVDLARLEIGEVIRAGSLPLPTGVTLVTDPEEAVVTTEGLRAAALAEDAEEGAVTAERTGAEARAAAEDSEE